MITVRAKKKLGEFQLDAELHDEGFICLCGRNGSGKTTLLSIISGLVAPDEGFVKIGSDDVTQLPIEKRRIVLVTPNSYIPHLNVDSHLRWGAKARGVEDEVNENQINRIKKALGITFSEKMYKLSLGMRERVALGTALLSKPYVVLVDEAFSNIDNKEDFIKEYRSLCMEHHLDAIFTTQFPEDAYLADHQYAIENGKTTRLS